MTTMLRVTWEDRGCEAQCAPSPDFPHGMDFDLRLDKNKPSCSTDLPYPAKRIGMFTIECLHCGIRVGLTTAGRPDDPRSVIIPCELKMADVKKSVGNGR